MGKRNELEGGIMQVGDLVKLKGDWVQVNPWMKDTELDDSPEECGIIIEISGKRHPLYKVLWQNGLTGDKWADELEVMPCR